MERYFPAIIAQQKAKLFSSTDHHDTLLESYFLEQKRQDEQLNNTQHYFDSKI